MLGQVATQYQLANYTFGRSLPARSGAVTIRRGTRGISWGRIFGVAGLFDLQRPHRKEQRTQLIPRSGQ